MLKVLSDKLNIQNPKQVSQNVSVEGLYTYYAGFAQSFAKSLVASVNLNPEDIVLDPWNGSGTTTRACFELGYRSYGFDLNPVMTMVSKANLIGFHSIPHLKSTALRIIKESRKVSDKNPGLKSEIHDDPLLTWFTRESVIGIRAIESCIQQENTGRQLKAFEIIKMDEKQISNSLAFFYVALFRSLRITLKDFIPTNPTWIKKPRCIEERVHVTQNKWLEIFGTEISGMLQITKEDLASNHVPIVRTASSEALPLENSSVDLVLSSPPYCTRIDYAVATMPELSLLGYAHKTDFRHLRTSLIGSSTVPSKTPKISNSWGETCVDLLNNIYEHPSKASKSYYHKNHVQYFQSVFNSLSEIHRVLKPSGQCFLVVQDSFYKEIHNDLPHIFSEMSQSLGMSTIGKYDFPKSRTMAHVNRAVRERRKSVKVVESVLHIKRY